MRYRYPLILNVSMLMFLGSLGSRKSADISGFTTKKPVARAPS